MSNQKLEIALTKALSRDPINQNQKFSIDLFREIIQSTIYCAMDSKPGINGLEVRISGVDTIINGVPTKCISVFTSPEHARDLHKSLRAEEYTTFRISGQPFLKILLLGSSLNTSIVINPNGANFAIPPFLASHLLFAASLYEPDLLLLAEGRPFNVVTH